MSDTTLEGFRLSPQQRRLAFVQATGFMPYARIQCRLATQLNPQLLQSALHKLIQRHEILRTTFKALSGMEYPLQVIGEPYKPQVVCYPSVDAAAAAKHTRSDHQGLQAMLIDHDQGQLLELVMPPLWADRISLELLMKELVGLCSDQVQAADEPVQYADLSEWLNDVLLSEEAAPGRAFWQDVNLSAVDQTYLPFVDYTGQAAEPIVQTVALSLPNPWVTTLETQSKQLGVSIEALLLAGWQALLVRLSQSNSIVVGVELDGRKYEELETAIGLFARQVPLITTVEPELSFRELARQTEQTLEKARRWQECFSWEFIQATNSSGCEHGFGYTQGQPALAESATIEHVLVWLERNKVQALWQHNPGKTIQGALAYDTSCCSQAYIEHVAALYVSLLVNCLDDVSQGISQLALCDQQQQAEMLATATGPQLADPVPLFLERFHAQLAAQPAAVAVADATTSLSYAALAAHAMALATTLRQHGVGPDAPVPLLADRSATTIAALLAIMLAGGAYVPIDPTTPAARIAQILDSLQPPLVLVEPAFTEQIPAHITTLSLASLSSDAALPSTEFSQPALQPHNLAYLIYTSGSSGTPKGVAVSHANLAHYLHAIDQRVPSGSGTRAALAVSLAADLGHTILFPTLANGGTLVVFDAATATDADAFATRMQQDAIDLLKLVPTHLSALLRSANPATVLPRQTLVLGGERVPWDLWQLLRSFAPELLLRNHYGPTETTVGVLTTVEEPQPGFSASVPLGVPLGHTRIYVLDAQQQLVPAGVRGNIYVGGALVSRGYVGQPAATAAAFLPDPWSPAPGARMYATGDQGRYGLDGTVEFLGRGDTQVKVRGYRVELGEIAAVLRNHEQIRDAAVIADTSTGDTRLTAYLVATGDSVPSRRELRRFLQAHVPDHMVPTTLLPIEALPLLPNGKLDRQTLAGLSAKAPAAANNAFIEPRNPTEATLASIWSEVLGGKRVGIDQNFFELGGDSILSIQIIARASQAGIKITPRQLFSHPTVAELAQVAGTDVGSNAEQGIINGPVALTPVQHWFFEQELTDSHHWNQAALLVTEHRMEPHILQEVVAHMLQQHDMLRTRYTRTEQGWQQHIAEPADDVPYQHIDLSQYDAREQQQQLETQAASLQASLNLAEGPLVRIASFYLGAEQRDRLLIIVHHLVIDSFSWEILLQDLHTAYHQRSHGQPIQALPKTTSFKQWAEQLTSAAQSQTIQQQRDYWLNQTSKAPVPIDIDGDWSLNRVGSTHNVSRSLTAEETRIILEVLPKLYNTQINDVLLTALLQTYTEWSGQPSILIDLEGHGREEDVVEAADLTRTIGWFTTRYPVHLTLQKNATPRDLLLAVKEQLRSIPQRGIGYGLLRYLCQDEAIRRQFASQPQPHINFNYLGQLGLAVSKNAPFVWADESVEPWRSPRGERRYLLDINAVVVFGEMKVTWTYSQQFHQQHTIERLAQRYIDILRTFIEHTHSQDAGGFSPSDFPQAKVSQTELDTLLAALNHSTNEEAATGTE